MKKIFVLASLALLSAQASAQFANHYGIKGGVNLSKLTVPFNEDSGDVYSVTNPFRAGFFVGGFAEKDLASGDQIVGEALITYQGSGRTKYSVHNGGFSSQHPIAVLELSLPVSYRHSFNEKFFVNGGASIGFMLSTVAEGGSRHVKFPNNTIDFGLLAGGGYRINDKVALEARYNLGLTNISSLVLRKSRVIQLGINYKLK